MLLLLSTNLLTILGVLTLWGPVYITKGSPEIQRKTVTLPGDIMIGALFSVHFAPGPKQAQTRTCGEVREQYGIQRVESAFQTVDEINRNSSILPNITLGIEIRDSCWYSPIALEQSIEFIRDNIAMIDDAALNASAIAEGEILCPRPPKLAKNLVGVIGPGSSTVTIQVQNLLQLFNIPQIGYSATSQDLSDKSFYKYFLRVVPSDFHQAKVLVDIVKRHNWTYVSAVHTDGSYGVSGIEVFIKLAQDAGICIATTDSVLSNAEDKAFDAIIRNLQKYPNARVVICFCEGMTVKGILRAAKRLNASGQFLFIGSDGWSDRGDVVANIEEVAVGGISVRIYSPYVSEFDSYYFNLTPYNNNRNPWFKEFWEHRFNCSLPDRKHKSKYNRTCTGSESLSEKYKQDTKMAFVKKAIYTMAFGLHNMQRELCPNKTGLCSAMMPVNGSVFLQYLMNVSFTWGNETVKFDSNGDPPGRYDIMNFQKLKDGSYDYILVGTWNSENLTIHRKIQWITQSKDGGPPESVCSKPCPRGQAKSIQSSSVKCCWVCVQCRENEYLKDEFTCAPCPLGWWPNENLTNCNEISVEYIHWTDTTAIVAMSIACLGFIATVFVMVVFIRYNSTPVVKSSTRELCYVIMVGMFLCHGTTFPLLAPPTQVTCYLSRVLPGFSFAMMYAALVTKTWRTVRILAGSKKKIITRKPRFMSIMAQVVITWLLIFVEVSIITAMLIFEPADSMLAYPSLDRVRLICNTTTLGIIAPLGFDFFLIAMCTVYAIKTRNVPENFNEAKFIGFTMYTTLVIWLAFIPIYFGSASKVITMCLSVSFSAIVALVLLFCPKVYIILFRPEKNNRSAFTTAKDVRCHIGYVNTGVSRNSSHSTSEFSVESPRYMNHSLTVQAKVSKGSNSLNLFHRFRIRKRDRLAANIAQRIRAIREAEAMDRRCNIRRIESSPFPPGIGKLPAVRSPSSGDDTPADGQDKKRLVGILRQAYGTTDEPESFQSNIRNGKSEKSIQTSDDLLESLLSLLKQRFVRSDTLMSMLSPEDDVSKDANYTDWREQLNNAEKCHISVIYPFNEFYPQDRTRIPLNQSNGVCRKKSASDRSNSADGLYSEIESVDTKEQVLSSMSRSEDSVAEARSSVMEESASSGSEDSCGSAVYKTIIINLGAPGLSISQDCVSGKRNSSSLHCLHTTDRLQHRPAGHSSSVDIDGRISEDVHSSIRWRHSSREGMTTRSHEDNLNG
ncbi:metabotropic glutamate receptor 1-like isoform X1 [Centruroides vittatus]|uniref:metabotropic glutamate receptor 1-like isoform X1 n=1 Tax=Centruroides vittatus TaxID=120091 RepID=UPI00350F98DD